MEKEKKSFMVWLKEHKKQLAIAGISIVSVLLIVATVKNAEELRTAWESLEKLICKRTEIAPLENTMKTVEPLAIQPVVNDSIVSIERIPHDVTGHVRNLHEGWVPSAEKIETALDNGFELLDGQTWVKSYSTGRAIA
jgi:hypothetical protein